MWLNKLLTLKLLVTVCQAHNSSINQKEFIIEEIWKDVKDYEGLYQVSNLGNIRSLDRYVLDKRGHKQFKCGVDIKPRHNSKLNVYEVSLYKDGKRKVKKVHTIVAQAFIENDDLINKKTVNHKDGDRSNNKANNLEWATYGDNERHAYQVLHRPVNRPKYNKRRCVAYNKNTKQLELYKSIMEAPRKTNISETQIRRIANKECVNKDYLFYIQDFKEELCEGSETIENILINRFCEIYNEEVSRVGAG